MDNGMYQDDLPISSTTECKICGQFGDRNLCYGMGWLRFAVPLDDPRFGKMFRCPNNPPAQDNEWQERLRRSSNLDSFGDKTFEDFHVTIATYTEAENRSLRLARDTAMRFAERPDGWLMLEGTYGCGKTHLAAAVGNQLVNAGESVIFSTVPDLLDHLRASYGPASEMAYDELFERMRNVKHLILDDLGVENPSPWAQEKLFQLFDHRYANKLTTIITTNRDLESLDPRIRSRLLDTNLTSRVKVSAPDYRTMRNDPQEQLMTNLENYRDLTFDTFDTRTFATPTEVQNLSRAKEMAWHYANELPGWLLLMGNHHTGKTHLAAAIAHHVRSTTGQEVIFVSVADLMDYLRMTFAPTAPVTFGKRFQEVKNVAFLVLDGFEIQHATPWAQEKLFQIIDHRYLTRLPTVITTIMHMEDLPERFASRLLDDRVCSVFAITVEGYVFRRRRR